jgi:cell wall assembly regulator SMI1
MNWKSHLSDISATLAQSDDLQSEYINNNLNWLGFDGATEAEIQRHEKRLSTSLPPSYKEFLKVSNGFKQLNCFVWNILPIDKVDWLKNFDPTLYQLYTTEFKDSFNATDKEYFVYGEEQKTTDFRSEYLVNSLAPPWLVSSRDIR